MNQDLYKPIRLNNLGTIKTEMFKVMSKHTNGNEPLFQYLEAKEFTEIPELKEQLQLYGIYDHICYSVINVSLQGSSNIHKDTGNFIYSLNIPLAGFEKTFLNFFSPNKDPEHQTIGDVSYLSYNRNECDLIGRFETNEPAVINTKVPHAFETPNSFPRIVILLRIEQSFDIQKLNF